LARAAEEIVKGELNQDLNTVMKQLDTSSFNPEGLFAALR
jgi:hypothetical protein